MKNNSLKSSTNSNILNISDAASLTGVQIETIEKYLDFGLLEITENKAGESGLLEEDLLTIFQPSKSKNKDTPKNTREQKQEQNQRSDKNSHLYLAKGKKSKEKKKKLSESADPEFLLEVIEINRNLRERIKSLTEDNNWLKDRIVSLEKSVEREQTLQAAQLETIGRLSRNNTSFLQESVPKISSGILRISSEIGKKGRELLSKKISSS